MSPDQFTVGDYYHLDGHLVQVRRVAQNSISVQFIGPDGKDWKKYKPGQPGTIIDYGTRLLTLPETRARMTRHYGTVESFFCLEVSEPKKIDVKTCWCGLEMDTKTGDNRSWWECPNFHTD